MKKADGYHISKKVKNKLAERIGDPPLRSANFMCNDFFVPPNQICGNRR